MPRLQVGLISRQAGGVPFQCARELYPERQGNRPCNLLLDREDVRNLPVVPLRPNMSPVISGDQFGADAETPPCSPDTTLHNIGNPERMGNRPDVLLLAFEGKG